MADSVAKCVQMAYEYFDPDYTSPYPASYLSRPGDDVYGKPIQQRPPYPTLDGLPVDMYNAKQEQAERPRCHIVRAEPQKPAGAVGIGYAGENILRGDLVRIDNHGTICLACF